MRAVQYVKNVPRWILMRGMGRRFPSLYTSRLGLLALRDVEPPALPTPQWLRIRPLLSGICGSDTALVTANGSFFFSPLTSTPFTLGHEVVGEVVEVGNDVTTCRTGDRVVIEPALGCTVRGIDTPCRNCNTGNVGNCDNITTGDISAGVQTGYCRDTSGGWSDSLVAHQTQIHIVPDDIPNTAAVLVEPLSCALHAILKVTGDHDSESTTTSVLVIGCGTMGLLTIATLNASNFNGTIVAIAKHPHQAELAKKLGANDVITPQTTLYADLCSRSGAAQYQPEVGKPTVLGGFDATFDCVGSSDTLDDALRFTQARGQVVVIGMPAIPKGVDWTTIWFKELRVSGAYAYGMETVNSENRRTFEWALNLLKERRVDLSEMVTHIFPLADYRRAVGTAIFTGHHKSVKTAFDLSDPCTS